MVPPAVEIVQLSLQSVSARSTMLYRFSLYVYNMCRILGIREEYGCILFNTDLFQMENICLYSSDKYIKSNDKYFVSGQSTNTFEARQISGENLVFI